jgi:hypothetical protein
MNCAPILFIIFSRPDTTAEVFQAIKRARPKKLYICADGPREGRPEEAQRCKQAREIATAVDWDCEVKTLFQEKNLGCKIGVSTGISWFFEHEELGIVIEDDILLVDSFFPFCSDLLERYKDDHRIASIGACNGIADKLVGSNEVTASYTFIGHNHVWGWGSWRRAWQKNDLYMKRWPQWDAKGGLLKYFDGDQCATQYWRGVFNKQTRGKGANTWDYQWMLSGWTSDALTIMPKVNMMTNLGFGDHGTNTLKGMPKFLVRNQARELQAPILHPIEVKKHPSADKLIKIFVTGLTHLRCFKRSLRFLIGLR